MTQRHCSLGNKAVLWEPRGQHAGGREGPWELGMGVGGQESLTEVGVGAGGNTWLFWGAKRGTGDTEGSGRTLENKV